MRDPKMPLQDLIVTGRPLKCSNVQARHIEEDKYELQSEDTKTNLVKVTSQRKGCNSSSTILPNYVDL